MHDVYTALRSRARPDLHMTLRYYPKATEQFVAKLGGRMISRLLQASQRRDFSVLDLDLTRRALFGPRMRRTIKVLLPDPLWKLPWWATMVRELAEPSSEKYPEFTPHVTTDEEPPLRLRMDEIVLKIKGGPVLYWWRFEGQDTFAYERPSISGRTVMEVVGR